MTEQRIHFTCASCGAKLATPASKAGRTSKCPKCSEMLTIPVAASLKSPNGHDIVDQLAADFKNIEKLLAVRLHPVDALKHEENQGCVAREFPPGLASVLVYDLPNMVVPVPTNHASGWKKSADELFRIGIRNVRGHVKLGTHPYDCGEGLRLWLIADENGNNLFTTTHAYFLGDYLAEPCPNGIVFALPQRRCVFYLPLDGPQATRGVELLVGTAFDMFRQGPESLSPNVYWWRQGRIELLPSRVEGKTVVFVPPAEFLAVLRTT